MGITDAMATHEHLVKRKAQLEQELSGINAAMAAPSLPHWKHERLNKKRELLKTEWTALSATLAVARDRRREAVVAKIDQRTDRLAFVLTKLVTLKDVYVSNSKSRSMTEAARFIYGKVVDDLDKLLNDIRAEGAAHVVDGPVASIDLDHVRASLDNPRKVMTFESAYAMGMQTGGGAAGDVAMANAEWGKIQGDMPELAGQWVAILGELIARSAFVNGYLNVPMPSIQSKD